MIELEEVYIGRQVSGSDRSRRAGGIKGVNSQSVLSDKCLLRRRRWREGLHQVTRYKVGASPDEPLETDLWR